MNNQQTTSPLEIDLDVMQSHPLCRMQFSQYQASSAALGWLGDRVVQWLTNNEDMLLSHVRNIVNPPKSGAALKPWQCAVEAVTSTSMQTQQLCLSAWLLGAQLKNIFLLLFVFWCFCVRSLELKMSLKTNRFVWCHPSECIYTVNDNEYRNIYKAIPGELCL